MRKREWNLLFSEYDLRAVLDAQLEKVAQTVVAFPRDRFLDETDEYISANIASELVVSPIELGEDEIEVSTADTHIDVSHDFERAVWDRSRPAYIEGLEVTYHLPFAGESELLKCRPSTYTSNPPRAVVASRELMFPYDSASRDVSATKPLFQKDLQTLKEWLARVNAQVGEYNRALEQRVREKVTQRRADLERERAAVQTLGFKVRGQEPKRMVLPEAERTVVRKRTREVAKREFDVALSFAGEDREYVDAVAQSLKGAGVEVFYDKFEQVDLWGRDLAEHLGEIYGKRSRFVVLFLSKSYAAKAWPTHEKRSAIAAQLSGRATRLLPVRFDDTEVPGLPATVSYLDLRVLSPDKLAELVKQKLDLGESDV